jgi:molybdate transport repressor ModE-like protein
LLEDDVEVTRGVTGFARAPLRGLQLHRVLDPLRLRLVVEIGRHGSISRAAEALSIGQPSASAHLRTLEAALGRRLVERDGRASRLTLAGELVAREGAHALAVLDRIEHQLEDLAIGRSRTLRLAACDSLGEEVLVHAISGFHERVPDAEVEVRSGTSADVLRQVMAGDAQIGIAGEVGPRDGVRRGTLWSDELVGVIATAAAPRSGRFSLDELAARTLVRFPDGSSTQEVVDRALLVAGIQPVRTTRFDTPSFALAAVARGLGVTFVPARSCRRELARGELRAFVADGFPPMSHTLSIISPPGAPPDRLETLLESLLVDAFSDLAAG